MGTTDIPWGKQVADQTAEYLGGFRRLALMIGADRFTYDEEGTLRFMFKGSRKMNAVEFILNGADLYDVNFLRCTTKGQTIVVQHTDLFFDQLKDVFEEETGLYLSLY